MIQEALLYYRDVVLAEVPLEDALRDFEARFNRSLTQAQRQVLIDYVKQIHGQS